jgi:integrase
MARRLNHEGSIYQRSDGYWVCSLRLGSQRLVRYAKTRSEAGRKLQALLREHHQGTLTHPTKLTLREWVEHWLTNLDLRPSTLRTYRQVVMPVVDDLGHQRLDKLTPALLATAYTKLSCQGKGARQRQLSHGYLKSCLERAVDLDLLGRNPMAKVRRPRWEPQSRQYWSLEEAARFIANCEASTRRWSPLFIVLTTCGLRISEALALTWADVDLDTATLGVQRALVWAGDKYSIGPVKTKAGQRMVSVPEVAVSVLRRLRNPAPDPQAPVFRTSKGTPPTSSQLPRPLSQMCAEAGVPRINIHGLRHVAAVLALRAINDVHAVQRRLGHSHVSVTMGIYAYATRDDAEVADGVGRLLAGSHAD